MMIDSELREELAALAHKQWAGWMRHQFKKGVFNKDGTWTMPESLVRRWTRQMGTDYDNLPKREKESDQVEANRVLKILAARQ